MRIGLNDNWFVRLNRLYSRDMHFVKGVLPAFFILAIGLSLPCFGGTPTYPDHVHADNNGVWTATIYVSGTSNPMFQVDYDRSYGTSVGAQETINLGEGHWKIILKGQLSHPSRPGCICFTVDPEGVFVGGCINIETAESIPTVSQWGLIVMGLLLLTAGAVVIARRRVRPI